MTIFCQYLGATYVCPETLEGLAKNGISLLNDFKS